MSAILYKDITEQDSTKDYYAVVMRLWDLNNSQPAQIVYDLNAYVGVSGTPSNGGVSVAGSLLALQPQSGITLSQSSVTLSAEFISVSVDVPYQVISTSTSVGNTRTTVNWNVYSPIGTSTFGNYAEVGLAFSVPEDATANLSLSAGVDCSFSPPCSNDNNIPPAAPTTMSALLSYTPPDFSITGPNQITLIARQTYTIGLSLISQPSFQGTVYLSDSNVPSGFTTSFSPSSVTIGGGSTASVFYLVTSPSSLPPTYQWTVNARTVAATQLSHTWTLMNDPPDFSVSQIPNMYINQGGSSNTAITFTSLGGFAGYLYPIGYAPSSITAVPVPSTVALPTGSTASTTLVVTIPSSTPIAQYNAEVQVTGYQNNSGNTVIHTVNFYIIVTSPPSGGGGGGGGGGPPKPTPPTR